MPNIKSNYLTYGYDNSINSPNKERVSELEMKLVVLTFVFDNICQNIVKKNLYFVTKNNPEKTYSKKGFRNSISFKRTAH